MEGAAVKLTLESAEQLLALKSECEQELAGLVVALAALHGTRCDKNQPKDYQPPFWIVVNELRNVAGLGKPYAVFRWNPEDELFGSGFSYQFGSFCRPSDNAVSLCPDQGEIRQLFSQEQKK